MDQARSWGIPPRTLLADADYGEVTALRAGLEERGVQYLVGADPQTGVWREMPRPVRRTPTPQGERWDYGGQKSMAAREAVEQARCWQRIRWREGTKGWLEGEFCALRVHPSHGYQNGDPPLKQVWLLAEKTNTTRCPVRYYLSDLAATQSLRELVKVLKSRWVVEHDYRQMKRELGLDHFEGRGWRGWHHHLTLVMMAYGFLTLETLRRKKNFWVDLAPDTP